MECIYQDHNYSKFKINSVIAILSTFTYLFFSPHHEYVLATEDLVFAQLVNIKITSYAPAMLFLA